MAANKDRNGKKPEDMSKDIDPEDEYLTSEELEDEDRRRVRKLKDSKPKDKKDRSNKDGKKNRSNRQLRL